MLHKYLERHALFYTHAAQCLDLPIIGIVPKEKIITTIDKPGSPKSHINLTPIHTLPLQVEIQKSHLHSIESSDLKRINKYI